MKYFFLAVCLALIISSASALTKDDILFHAPFDNALAATTAKGNPAPVVSPPQPKFVEGRSGQGILTGDAASTLTYATRGNMELEAGSVAMWVKPTDWSKDTYMRFFFGVGEAADAGGAGEGNFLWLYKFFSSSLYWLAQMDRPERKVYLVAPRSSDRGGDVAFDWEAGKWSHLIGSWSGNQLTLYINGQFVGVTYLPASTFVRRLGAEFRIGGPNRRGEGTADTVIDDLLILRRPVAPDEARLIYEKGLQAFDSPFESKPLLQLAAGFLPSRDSLSLSSSIIGLRPDEFKNFSLRYRIAPEQSEQIALTGQSAITHLQQRVPVSTSKLPRGKYRIEAELLRDNVLLARAESSFEKTAPAAWQGNQLGVIKTLPAPWTPIARRNNHLSCWGRTYDWGAGALPQQITTQNQNLLSRPITLRGVVDGRDSTLQNVRLRWRTSSSLRSEFDASGDLNGVPVAVRGWMEFDGFIWCRITVGDKKRAKHALTSLSLEIPLRADAATLMQGRPPVPKSGAVRPFNGVLRFAPVIWLGNERGGLQWSTQDLRDWHLNDSSKMASLVVEKNEVLLRFQFLDHKVEAAPLEYSIGLHATPVKPLSRERRAWEMELGNINSEAGQTRKGWAFYWSQWNRVGSQKNGPYGYQVAGAGTWTDLNYFQAHHQIPWIYWHMHSIWPGDPTLKSYSGEWGGAYRENSDAFSLVEARHDIPSLRDYMVWQTWNTLKTTPGLASAIRGVYIDVAQATWDQDEDGSAKQFSIMGTRELQQRFYFMLKEWPHLSVANHQSGDVEMSQLAFADMMVTGEHLTTELTISKEKNYHNILTLDGMRAEYNGANFGIPMVFLPEIGRALEGDESAHEKAMGKEGLPAAEHLLGMLWSHDVIPWNAYVYPEPFKQAGRAKDFFGWDENTRFLGYWENEKLVNSTSNQSPVVTSLFLREGKVLFVIMNNSDTDAQVALKPDWKALKMNAPASLIDAYAEQHSKEKEAAAPPSTTFPASTLNVPVANGSASFAVRARNFRALVAR